MLTVSPSVKMWFAAAVDLRLGFDGLMSWADGGEWRISNTASRTAWSVRFEPARGLRLKSRSAPPRGTPDSIGTPSCC